MRFDVDGLAGSDFRRDRCDVGPVGLRALCIDPACLELALAGHDVEGLERTFAVFADDAHRRREHVDEDRNLGRVERNEGVILGVAHLNVERVTALRHEDGRGDGAVFLRRPIGPSRPVDGHEPLEFALCVGPLGAEIELDGRGLRRVERRNGKGLRVDVHRGNVRGGTEHKWRGRRAGGGDAREEREEVVRALGELADAAVGDLDRHAEACGCARQVDGADGASELAAEASENGREGLSHLRWRLEERVAVGDHGVRDDEVAELWLQFSVGGDLQIQGHRDVGGQRKDTHEPLARHDVEVDRELLELQLEVRVGLDVGAVANGDGRRLLRTRLNRDRSRLLLDRKVLKAADEHAQ